MLESRVNEVNNSEVGSGRHEVLGRRKYWLSSTQPQSAGLLAAALLTASLRGDDNAGADWGLGAGLGFL